MSVKFKTTEWHQTVIAYRKGVTQCLLAIRQGNVDEETLDKLSNFCQNSLALMQIVGQAKFKQAQNHAEIADFIHTPK